MAAVTDQDRLDALAAVAADLHVDLGHQRAGCVEHLELAAFGLLPHRPRHAVGAEDHVAVVGNLVELVDEDRALALEVVDDVAVVHDLVANVNRRAEQLDRALDDLDRAVDAGAKAAGIGEQNFHQCRVSDAAGSLSMATILTL